MSALVAACAIALLSCIGVVAFGSRQRKHGDTEVALPLSVGAFLGIAIFELLPEAFEATEWASLSIALGFLGFFLLSRAVSEYHHHHQRGEDCDHGHEESHSRARGALVLLGDGVHNLADGVVIAVAFGVSPALGIATTIGIALHEVPQEIAEFSILRHAGFSKRRALLWNFTSALAVVLGVLLTNLFTATVSGSIGILVGIAAGNLLYIAASDLLPTLEMPRGNTGAFMKQFSLVALGILLIATLLFLTH